MKRAREEAQKKGERKKRGERRMERKKRRRREKRGSGCIDRGPAAPGAWAGGRRRRRACCRERQVGWARVGFFFFLFLCRREGENGTDDEYSQYCQFSSNSVRYQRQPPPTTTGRQAGRHQRLLPFSVLGSISIFGD